MLINHRHSLAATLLVAAALATVGDSRTRPASAAAGVAPEVRVATTGSDSELVKRLPITRRRGVHERVVMSLGPDSLPSLAEGDRLSVTAEFQVTGNCASPDPRCTGPIYHYDPIVRARLVLAADDRTAGGPGTVALGKVKRETCTQRRPDYEHHCVLVFTDDGLDLDEPSRLPCPLDACYLNLVADAHHPAAGSGDVVIVGGLRPNGKIALDRGRINVVRYRDSAESDFRTLSTSRPARRRLRPDFRRRVAFSQPLTGLRAGEQLAVLATMRTDVSRLRYAVRTSARLILAASPRATRQGEFVKRHALERGEISENNGSNCTQSAGTCITRKVGVLEMRRDALGASGQRVPLYVNLVTVLGPKVRKARPADRVVLRRGGITVVRFPPSVNG